MFEVYIEENSHHAEENSRLKIGEYEIFADALNRCKKVVDDFLKQNYTEGMTAEELYRLYTTFGEDVFIVGDGQDEFFSAWNYAEKRARETTRD